jgi:hypothetical protein
MSLDLGAKLGTYEIVAPIATSSGLEAYKAKDASRSVAIQVIPPEWAGASDFATRRPPRNRRPHRSWRRPVRHPAIADAPGNRADAGGNRRGPRLRRRPHAGIGEGAVRREATRPSDDGRRPRRAARGGATGDLHPRAKGDADRTKRGVGKAVSGIGAIGAIGRLKFLQTR